MKKNILAHILFLGMTANIFAQSPFFSTKEGQILTYAHMDAKGKIDSHSRQTIKKVIGTGSNITIEYTGQTLDKNRKSISDRPPISYAIVVKNGVLEIDMTSLFPPGMEGSIEFSGDKIKLPSSIKPGDNLDTINFTMTVDAKIMKVITNTTLIQECVAVEEITVPAGTFKCYKLRQTSTTTGMGNMVNKTNAWYASGVGIVRSEMFDGKDKLQSSMALQSIEN